MDSLKLTQQKLFSTQIYKKKLCPNFEQRRQLVQDIKTEASQIYLADKQGILWSKTYYPNGYTSYSSTEKGFDRLHKASSTFQNLESYINKKVKLFIKTLNYNILPQDLIMTHCWINIMGEGSQHQSHNHPLSVISGTFYVSVPKNSSCLKLEDPRMSNFMNTPSLKENIPIHQKRHVEVYPEEGDIILFESWLKHEVPLNKSKKNRISVSFNYGWK